MKNKKIVIPLGIVLILIFIVYAYDSIKPNPQVGEQPTCVNNPAVSVELGSPYVGGPTAEFTTNGGIIYAISRKFSHTGILSPKQFTQSIYVGLIDHNPIWDSQKNDVINATIRSTFKEGSYGKLNLPPGRYWLWSGGGDVLLVSCEPNSISDPLPARIGKPSDSLAVTCGGNYNGSVTQLGRTSPASHQPIIFSPASDTLFKFIAAKNIKDGSNLNSISTTDIYIGQTDKMPDWSDPQSILNNATNKITAQENLYNSILLTKGQQYWLWSDNEADIELADCQPKQ